MGQAVRERANLEVIGWLAALAKLSSVAAVGLAPAALAQPMSKASDVVVTFTPGRSMAPVQLRAPNGVVYALSIEKDGPKTAEPGYLDLVLHGSTSGLHARNLIEPAGRWHGIWPFALIATDFAPGSKPIYGRERVIKVQRSDLAFRVKILDVVVEPMRNGSGQSDYGFRKLVLRVDLEPIDKAGPLS